MKQSNRTNLHTDADSRHSLFLKSCALGSRILAIQLRRFLMLRKDIPEAHGGNAFVSSGDGTSQLGAVSFALPLLIVNVKRIIMPQIPLSRMRSEKQEATATFLIKRQKESRLVRSTYMYARVNAGWRDGARGSSNWGHHVDRERRCEYR